jgi:hypothetical protein
MMANNYPVFTHAVLFIEHHRFGSGSHGLSTRCNLKEVYVKLAILLCLCVT